MPIAPELPDTAAILAADVIALEDALAQSRDEVRLLRVMLSEALEISFQAVARLWQQTQERKA